MSITAPAAAHIEQIRRNLDETDEVYAKRLYEIAMESYSGQVPGFTYPEFHHLDEKAKDSWLRRAKIQ